MQEGGGSTERKTFTIDVVENDDNEFVLPYADNIEQMYAFSDFLFSLLNDNEYNNVAVQLSNGFSLLYRSSNYNASGDNGDMAIVTLNFIIYNKYREIVIYRRDLLKSLIDEGEDLSDIFIIKGSGTLPSGSETYKATFIIS